MSWTRKPKTGKDQPVVTAFDRACALLGRREYSRHELIKALILREYPQEEAEQAADRLAESGFQSDERFTASLIRQKVDKGQGSRRLEHDLKQHKLDPELVEAILKDNTPNWMSEAYKITQRKFGEAPYDRITRQKAFNFLLRRGFSMDVAGKVTAGVMDDFD